MIWVSGKTFPVNRGLIVLILSWTAIIFSSQTPLLILDWDFSWSRVGNFSYIHLNWSNFTWQTKWNEVGSTKPYCDGCWEVILDEVTSWWKASFHENDFQPVWLFSLYAGIYETWYSWFQPPTICERHMLR